MHNTTYNNYRFPKAHSTYPSGFTLQQYNLLVRSFNYTHNLHRKGLRRAIRQTRSNLDRLFLVKKHIHNVHSQILHGSIGRTRNNRARVHLTTKDHVQTLSQRLLLGVEQLSNSFLHSVHIGRTMVLSACNSSI